MDVMSEEKISPLKTKKEILEVNEISTGGSLTSAISSVSQLAEIITSVDCSRGHRKLLFSSSEDDSQTGTKFIDGHQAAMQLVTLKGLPNIDVSDLATGSEPSKNESYLSESPSVVEPAHPSSFDGEAGTADLIITSLDGSASQKVDILWLASVLANAEGIVGLDLAKSLENSGLVAVNIEEPGKDDSTKGFTLAEGVPVSQLKESVQIVNLTPIDSLISNNVNTDKLSIPVQDSIGSIIPCSSSGDLIDQAFQCPVTGSTPVQTLHTSCSEAPNQNALVLTSAGYKKFSDVEQDVGDQREQEPESGERQMDLDQENLVRLAISNVNKCLDAIYLEHAITLEMLQTFLLSGSPLTSLEDRLLHLAASQTTEGIFYCCIIRHQGDHVERSVSVARFFEYGKFKDFFATVAHESLKSRYDLSELLPYTVYTEKDIDVERERRLKRDIIPNSDGSKFSHQLYIKVMNDGKQSVLKLCGNLVEYVASSKTFEGLFLLVYVRPKKDLFWGLPKAPKFNANGRFLYCNDQETELMWEEMLLNHKDNPDIVRLPTVTDELPEHLNLEAQFAIVSSLPNYHYWPWKEGPLEVKFHQRFSVTKRNFPASPRNKILSAICYGTKADFAVTACLVSAFGFDTFDPFQGWRRSQLSLREELKPVRFSLTETLGFDDFTYDKALLKPVQEAKPEDRGDLLLSEEALSVTVSPARKSNRDRKKRKLSVTDCNGEEYQQGKRNTSAVTEAAAKMSVQKKTPKKKPAMVVKLPQKSPTNGHSRRSHVEKVYMDYNATTPLADSVLAKISDALLVAWGNPSSSHSEGQLAKHYIDVARSHVARLIGSTDPGEVLFTSSGTEANNHVLKIAVKYFDAQQKLNDNMRDRRAHIITTSIEHDSVVGMARALLSEGLVDLSVITVDKDMGCMNPDFIVSNIRENTVLISVMMANNETGIIQPITRLCKEVKRVNEERAAAQLPRVLVHTDAAQTIGKINVSVEDLGVDYLTIVGHKFYGPRIGALYHRKEAPFSPLLIGGGQEQGRRAGTENTALIAGLGEAARVVTEGLKQHSSHLMKTRNYLEQSLVARFGDSVCFNGSRKCPRLPNTTNFSFTAPHLRGRAVLANCRHLQASVGAACHSDADGKLGSRNLLAQHVSEEMAVNAIRLSLGRETTVDDVDRAIDDLAMAVDMLNDKEDVKPIICESVQTVERSGKR